MAKLVEQLFPSPEIRSSNTVIGEFYLPDEKRKKRPWKAQFFKTAFSMGLIEKMTSVVTRQPDFLQKKYFWTCNEFSARSVTSTQGNFSDFG